MISVGIIGAGRIGTDHAERLLLTGQARPAVVFDVDSASATRLASSVGAQVVSSLTALIKHPEVATRLVSVLTDRCRDSLVVDDTGRPRRSLMMLVIGTLVRAGKVSGSE